MLFSMVTVSILACFAFGDNQNELAQLIKGMAANNEKAFPSGRLSFTATLTMGDNLPAQTKGIIKWSGQDAYFAYRVTDPNPKGNPNGLVFGRPFLLPIESGPMFTKLLKKDRMLAFRPETNSVFVYNYDNNDLSHMFDFRPNPFNVKSGSPFDLTNKSAPTWHDSLGSLNLPVTNQSKLTISRDGDIIRQVFEHQNGEKYLLEFSLINNGNIAKWYFKSEHGESGSSYTWTQTSKNRCFLKSCDHFDKSSNKKQPNKKYRAEIDNFDVDTPVNERDFSETDYLNGLPSDVFVADNIKDKTYFLHPKTKTKPSDQLDYLARKLKQTGFLIKGK